MIAKMCKAGVEIQINKNNKIKSKIGRTHFNTPRLLTNNY